jgi:3-phosphoshikimate 1-carboxyvinyltransferase
MTDARSDPDMTLVRVPGDKSVTHRALLLAALATGRSRVRRPLAGEDTQSTARVLRQLGCAVSQLDADGEVVIHGVGLRGLREPAAVLDCGNSGTTARLLLGALAGQAIAASLTGDASLRARPMGRVTQPLAAMGATFEELGEPGRLPLRVTGGALRGLDHVSPHASAQVKSAVLLAGLTSGVPVSIEEPVLSRDHTERMLTGLGVRLTRHTAADGTAYVASEPIARLDPLDTTVPGDFSSAAFVIAHAALSARRPVRIAGVGINPTRTGLLGVLQRMGVSVTIENVRDSGGEPVADLVVVPAPLRAAEVGGTEVPSLIDEVPIIAILAARAVGTTVITGARELRVKESDRIAAIVANLRAIGIAADELPDGLVVSGTDHPLAGSVACRHDHRIAMAFGVLAARPGNDIAVDDRDCVSVSYPGFWSMLHEVAGT